MADLTDHATALADAVDAALPGWVVRCVDGIHRAWAGCTPEAVMAEAARAGGQACRDIGARLRSLLELDVDRQPTTPLAVLREAVRYPTAVLAGAGVPGVVRDEYAQAAFPEDPYDLTPASFADFGSDVQQRGLAWGAAKAWVHHQRHATEAP